MSQKKVLIFVPTYNERTNVESLFDRIRALKLDADLVFLDDNSPDGTGELLDELARKHPRLTVIHRAAKLGIGSAHLDGIAYAYDKGYDLLVTLDADFTHAPEAIPSFLERAADVDVVVGSRYLESDSLPGWNLMRRSLTMLGHALTEHVLGMSEDATGAFRVYNLERIPRHTFALVQSRGYSFFFESLFILSNNGYSIAEVALKLPARTYGSSKMSYMEIGRSVKMIGSLYLATKTNPARFRVAPDPDFDPGVVDVQNWNDYWNKKERRTTLAYELIATAYRNQVIKRRLEATIKKEFAPGVSLLHAGCGSGQVDHGLHDRAKITAVDVSETALRIYSRENPQAYRVQHASIFELPFADASFDGAYNLGVVEHFLPDELGQAFTEIRRVIKPGGKMVVFWPHARATSVAVLKTAHWMLNDVLDKNVRFHPPEPTLVHSRDEAQQLFARGGLELESYDFGVKDFWVQAVAVARRPS